MTDTTPSSRDAAIPAGMKPWHGGDSAPADWPRFGRVAFRNGETSQGATDLEWRNRGYAFDIIAYTPKPPIVSNDEGMVEAFEREDRYIVFKKSHLTGEQLERLERLTNEGPRGLPSSSHDYPLPTVECVVVESDWPEYEPVWRMIQERMETNHVG